jgi:ribosomal protein S18 acetylase RimI-like enzyme
MAHRLSSTLHDVARIALRGISTRDTERLITDGVVGGPLPAGESWLSRIEGWIAEMQAGRRLVMVADDGRKLLGVAQLVFKLPAGKNDPEAANGLDIAMVETLRATSDAPAALATQMINELENYAKKRRIKTITFLVPMDNNRVLAQVKGWGFEEFRIMPEGTRLLAFFKKAI